MSKLNTTYKFAGITVHVSPDKSTTRTKVRYGNDFVLRLKQLNSAKKIEDKRLGVCMLPERVQLIELPIAMVKYDALNFLLSHEAFQSAEDQALIQEEIDMRRPKPARSQRVRSTKTVRSTSKSAPSLDSIKRRAKKSSVTLEQVLEAVAQPLVAEQESTELTTA
jgi:hypothetical protein